VLSYMDTSAVVRVYLHDEPDHDAWRDTFLDPGRRFMSSRLLDVEMTAAVSAARRARRVRKLHRVLQRFEADSSDRGRLALVPLTGRQASLARELVLQHRIRSLDALHVAAAMSTQRVLGDVVFVTYDERQAEVGRQVGLTVQTAPSAA
jgi:uncharacterized protein